MHKIAMYCARIYSLCNATAKISGVTLRVLTTDAAGPRRSDAVEVTDFPMLYPGGYEVFFSPALYGKLKELIDNESLGQRIVRGGYQRVQHLSWDRAGQHLEKTYGLWLSELQGKGAQKC